MAYRGLTRKFSSMAMEWKEKAIEKEKTVLRTTSQLILYRERRGTNKKP